MPRSRSSAASATKSLRYRANGCRPSSEVGTPIAAISPMGSRSLAAWICRTTVRRRQSCSNTTPIRRPLVLKRVSRSGNGCRRCGQRADQFNSLHEQLIAIWRKLRALSSASRLHFTAVADSQEDWGNLDYLRDTAMQAGWQTFSLPVERIGWNGTKFVDEFNRADRGAGQTLSVGMAGTRRLRAGVARERQCR